MQTAVIPKNDQSFPEASSSREVNIQFLGVCYQVFEVADQLSAAHRTVLSGYPGFEHLVEPFRELFVVVYKNAASLGKFLPPEFLAWL